MKCTKCGFEVYKLRTIYVNGEKIEACPSCIDTTPIVDFRNSVTLSECNGKQFSIGVAHLKDIKSRRVDPVSKEVYRDTKKTYFCSTTTGGRK